TITNTLLIDFNGDGYPDLVTGGTALASDSSGCPASSISVRFSQFDMNAAGHRSFAAPVCVDASGPLSAMQLLYEADTSIPLEYTMTDYPTAITEPGVVEKTPQ